MMGDTTRTTATPVVRVCPLCAGTGRRRIRIPNIRRLRFIAIDCDCGATQDGDE